MKIKPWLVILILALVLVGIGYLLKDKIIPSQEKKIKQLEEEITFLKQETVPIKYKLLDNSNDTVKVSVKFFDLDGNTVNKHTFVLPGNVVSFDFAVVKFKDVHDRYIAFPEKIFTNKIAPSDGETLFKYYEKDGYPQIFYSKDMSKKFRNGIEELYKMVKSGQYGNEIEVFGSMVENVRDPKYFKPGNIYKIVVHTKGGIEIMQD